MNLRSVEPLQPADMLKNSTHWQNAIAPAIVPLVYHLESGSLVSSFSMEWLARE